MSTYQILLDGTAADDAFYDAVSTLEVEENAAFPDALRLVLPAQEENGDLTWAGDHRIRPFANIAVVATGDEGGPQCIFDGYVTSHKVHVPRGITSATVEVRAQDASVLMSLEHKSRSFDGVTEGEVANQIFGEYGFTTSPVNTQDDSPSHAAPGHTLTQRGTDLDLLRRLARRSGRWFRVAGGTAAGAPVGFFGLPDLGGAPVCDIVLDEAAENPSVTALDFTWDVARPSKVLAAQASLTDTDPNGVVADTADSGLALLDARGLREFTGREISTRLTTPGDTADLPGRARAVLREAGWFADCEGVTDAARIHRILRVGWIVRVTGVGQLLSGKYLITGVRHTITPDSHTMAFTLTRNAVGPAPAGSGSGLPSVPGGL